MNLIPDKIPETGAYYCTWATQARVRPMSMGDDALDVRNALTDELLFGEKGVLSRYFDGIRGDITALLDDGWDVPLGTNNPADRHKFGSLELDCGRFPSFTGAPVERLTRLADAIRELGYKGVGVWVACQAPFEPESEADLELELERRHFENCAKMSHAAGISYWKVDWGRHSSSAAYREMLTDCVRKFAPELKIEHHPAAMFPPFGKFGHVFTEAEREHNRRIFAASNYVRTYDVLGEFANAITLNRVAMLLSEGYDGGILNVEDALYLGAGLGCSLGIMRHPRFEPGRERRNTTRYDEIVRALRWQRISPPFSGGDCEISDEILTDSHAFPPREPDLWPFVAGKTLESPAPAKISRGCELASVESDGEKPYVVCAKNPVTGAFSVAALNRTVGGKLLEYLPARVEVGVADASKPLGIFGRYESLTVKFDCEIVGRRIFAQDLASAEAVELTAAVGICQNYLTLDGSRIAELAPSSDGSAPGIVLVLY